MQLIPSMDLMQGRIVRLRHGDPDQVTFYDLDPADWIARLVGAGARRIHLVDLDGAFGRARQDRFAAFPARFPGVAFEAVVGTLAVEQPSALKGLPRERIIAALDLQGDRIVTRGWQAPSPCASTDVFEALLALGFDRALVTDVSRDGTLQGPGVQAAAWVAREGFQVQASGGLKDLDDLTALTGLPGVVGAISGKALLEGLIPLDDPRTRAALAGVA
jgi:phosphoribosylformimino-5-aminoimidazole carboxamide ribotide isomerase